MQTDKEEKGSLPNTETRELFLDASTDDLPSRGLLDTIGSEKAAEQSKDEALKDE